MSETRDPPSNLRPEAVLGEAEDALLQRQQASNLVRRVDLERGVLLQLRAVV